jgi:hypothetical protein
MVLPSYRFAIEGRESAAPAAAGALNLGGCPYPSADRQTRMGNGTTARAQSSTGLYRPTRF